MKCYVKLKTLDWFSIARVKLELLMCGYEWSYIMFYTSQIIEYYLWRIYAYTYLDSCVKYFDCLMSLSTSIVKSRHWLSLVDFFIVKIMQNLLNYFAITTTSRFFIVLFITNSNSKRRYSNNSYLVEENVHTRTYTSFFYVVSMEHMHVPLVRNVIRVLWLCGWLLFCLS